MQRKAISLLQKLLIITLTVFSPGIWAASSGSLLLDIPARGKIESVYIQSITQPERIFPEILVSATQPTVLSVPSEMENEFFIIHIKDLDSNNWQRATNSDTQLHTREGIPGDKLGMLLVSGRQINQGTLILNVLSDYISRRTEDYAEQETWERLTHYQNGIAQALIAQDIDGDGVIGFSDALTFDPSRAEHRTRLAFDYNALLRHQLSTGLNLRDTYRQDPQAIEHALHEAFDSIDTFDLPDQDNTSLHTVEIETGLGGTILIDEYPEMRIDPDNDTRLIRFTLREDGQAQTLTLRVEPQPGWKFMAWNECPQVNKDASCTVPADQDRHVSAVFDNDESQDPDLLASGIIGVVKLGGFDPEDYHYEVAENGVMRVTSVSNSELAAQLAASQPGTVIASTRWEYPLMKITQVNTLESDGYTQFSFWGVPVEITEVYQSLTAYLPPVEPRIENVEMVKVFYSSANESALAQPTANPLGAFNHRRNAQPNRVWITGYGLALEAGEGFYLVAKPSGQGFQLIRPESPPRTLSLIEAEAVLFSACDHDPSSPACSLVAPSLSMPTSGKSCSIFPLLGFTNDQLCSISLIELELGDKKKSVLVGKFKVEADIDLRTYAGTLDFKYSVLPPGIDLETKSRGLATFNVAVSAFAGAQYKTDLASSLAKSACGQGVPVKSPSAEAAKLQEAISQPDQLDSKDDWAGAAGEALGSGPIEFCGPNTSGQSGSVDLFPEDKLRIAIQLNSTSPDGLVMPLKFGVGIVANFKGSAGLDAKAAFRFLMPFDLDVSIGEDCVKVPYVGYTTCATIKVPQKAEGEIKTLTNSKYQIGFTANAEFAPGIDASFTWGPRGINESLLQAGVGASIPIKLVGTFPLFGSSNFPEDKAANLPDSCGFGSFSYAFGMETRLDIYAKVNPKLEFKVPVVGTTLKFTLLDEFNLFRKFWTWPWIRPTLVKGSGSFKAGYDPEACLPIHQQPMRLAPASVSWDTAGLNWDTPGSQVVTKTHQLILQKDGNLVLYRLERSNGGAGGFDPEKGKAVWATNTDRYPGTRVQFQADGNLVTYSIKESVHFASNTKDKGKKLELTADGHLQIKDGSGNVVWRRPEN